MPFIFFQRNLVDPHLFMSSHQTTILIAEPHPENRELYAGSLSSLEIEVETCATPEELYSAISLSQPDALLFSVSLPSGLGLLREVKRLRPALPIIVLGEISEHHQSRLMELGVSAHLNPRYIKPQDIATTVRHLLTTIN